VGVGCGQGAAIHAYVALHTGQVVDFRHAVAYGKARVMWNVSFRYLCVPQKQ
jgi:hypothetical protein